MQKVWVSTLFPTKKRYHGNAFSKYQKLKEQVAAYLDRIADELKLIGTQPQELQPEILVEYKRTVNVAYSIQTVIERKRQSKKKQQREPDSRRNSRQSMKRLRPVLMRRSKVTAKNSRKRLHHLLLPKHRNSLQSCTVLHSLFMVRLKE